MATPCISVRNMTMAYGDFIIQRDLDFTISRGDIFIIMGGSGCGKSTLLMHMIGLQSPAKGDVLYGEESLWHADHKMRQRILKQTGVLFQSGALLSSMTLAMRHTQNLVVALTAVLMQSMAAADKMIATDTAHMLPARSALKLRASLKPHVLCQFECSTVTDQVLTLELSRVLIGSRKIVHQLNGQL